MQLSMQQHNLQLNLSKNFVSSLTLRQEGTIRHYFYSFRKFAVSMCNKVSEMIQGLATPAHRKLQLIPILQHMHHDISTAGMVYIIKI